MLGLDYFLLNFLFILVGVLTCFSLGYSKHKHHRMMIGFFGCASVLFCMSFPFTVFPGYIFDLRIIPLLITLMYGGLVPGFAAAIVLLLYRYYLGGSGFLVTGLTYIPMFIIASCIIYKVKSYSNKGNIFFGTFWTFATSVAVSAGSLIRSGEVIGEHAVFFIYYCLLLMVCGWISFSIIETMRDNNKMRDEIYKAEKLSVLGELAATIAHEIRNPIQVSRGFLQLIRARSVSEQAVRYSDLAIEEIDRAEAIISDYLMYAKPQADKMETIEVAAHLQHILSIMEPYITSNGHAVLVEIKEEDSLYIQADSKKLTQVLVNLIKNAVEAMAEPGSLTLRVYRSRDDVVMEVIDKGVGMDSAQVALLGNPFYTTKSKGTGLGLMVSYRIVEALGGSIEVHSRKGEGTRFKVIIPCAKSERAPE